MSAAAAENMDANRPVIMFVDDEPRVLKSMRAMFRRDYDVHLANSGAEALDILADNDIDVVVSDQRMPEMTGVEVLTQIKSRSPDTVRILLTGYADLAAVEASINEAEVFKYLMKPCPAEEVRGAVLAGLGLTTEPVQEPVSNVTALKPDQPGVVEAVAPVQRDVSARRDKRAGSVGVLVLSNDKALYDGVSEACPSSHKLHHANTVDTALQIVSEQSIGVLVTDVGVDEKEISELSDAVREVTPDMVIILASERSDANMLIQLINSGQVFRFLLKPLQIGQCKIWLASALRRFVAHGDGTGSAGGEGLSKTSNWRRFKNWFLGLPA